MRVIIDLLPAGIGYFTAEVREANGKLPAKMHLQNTFETKGKAEAAIIETALKLFEAPNCLALESDQIPHKLPAWCEALAKISAVEGHALRVNVSCGESVLVDVTADYISNPVGPGLTIDSDGKPVAVLVLGLKTTEGE